MLDPVAITGLLVAAIRAEESAREDALFRDPFADSLAGDEGRTALASYRVAAGVVAVPVIAVRTHFYDDALRRVWQEGIRQFVFLAAGMDARAYRLPWPDGTRLFEIDRAAVIAAKAERLAGAEPTCHRVAIGMSLTDDWPAALRAAGFDPAVPTSFSVEGLLQYLDEPTIDAIFADIDQLAGPRSHLLYDIVGRSLLESPVTAAVRRMMSDLGAPWQTGTDTPAVFAERHGWTATVTEPAILGTALNRWPIPVAPPGTPGVPRSYLVEATKPRC